MSENKMVFGDCPYCSTSYSMKTYLGGEVRECQVCHGRFEIGERYEVKVMAGTTLTYARFLPRLDGDTFTVDGYTVRDGVLVSAENVGDEVSIPVGTIAIGREVFKGNKRIKSVYIPDGVLYIGQEAFAECEGIRTVRLPDGLVAMANSAFTECRRLTEVTIPESLKYGGYSIFHGCDNLTELFFPMDMVILGGSPCRFCRRLKRTNIPHCVINIGYWFSETDMLEEVIIGGGVYETREIPTERLKSAVFTRTDGWYLREGYTKKLANVPPEDLADPKKAALLLYRAKKDKNQIVHRDIENTELYYKDYQILPLE